MSLSIVQNHRELWVHIEITPECGPVKYEFDPKIGLVVDRFMRMPMHYPLPYGYVPHTLCEDGDALDVLVIVPYPVMPTSWLRVRPIAVLVMEDEKGMDEKLLAVPMSDVSSAYDDMSDVNDVSQDTLDAVAAFFELYKNLDKNKWSKIHGWKSCDEAEAVVRKSMERYQLMLIQ